MVVILVQKLLSARFGKRELVYLRVVYLYVYTAVVSLHLTAIFDIDTFYGTSFQ